jgi:HNH endonuclease/AP2 domain
VESITEIIKLTQGHVALVSAEDADDVGRFKWCASVGRGGRVVAARSFRREGKTVSVLMHRYIAKPLGLCVDHIDRNPLNNARENLRIVTHAINRQNTSKQSNNTSGFKGVMRDKRSGKWIARIRAHAKTHHLGVHDNAELAALAYDLAARRLLGPLAATNF